MGKLLDFIIDNPVDNLTEEIYLTHKRFKNPDGSQGQAKLVIKAVTQEENQDYIKRASGKRNKRGQQDFDAQEYQMTLLINHVIEPDFKSEEVLKALGVSLPREAVNKFLLSGEILEIVSKITELSGFNDDPNEEIDEIKNS